MKGELLFRLTEKDFEITFYRGSGKGGQNRNKVETGVRIYHPESGAMAQSCEERTQGRNRSIAFKRLTETKEFKIWHKIKCAKILGQQIDIETWITDQMQPKNLKIEEIKNL